MIVSTSFFKKESVLTPDRIETKAHAKVNLYLEIIGLRPDGFHEIESLMAPVSLADDLLVERSGGGISLETPGFTDVPPEKNLAWRAADLFLQKSGARSGVRMVLEKKVPAGAGLGGGSSDAAAVLRAMDALFPGLLSVDELLGLAARIGSDVPFFLCGGAAWVRGRGELVEPVTADEKPSSAVLVYPGFGVPTAWAYKEWDRWLSSGLTARGESDKNSPPIGAACFRGAGLFNAFEECVFPAHGELGRAKAGLVEAGAAGAIMSGSGSTVFGVFDDAGKAASAVIALERMSAGWRVFPVEVMPVVPWQGRQYWGVVKR